MAVFEFFIRVDHPNETVAEQHAQLLRESVYAHAKVVHTMLNGTTTVSPTKKIIKHRKRKPSTPQIKGGSPAFIIQDEVT